MPYFPQLAADGHMVERPFTTVQIHRTTLETAASGQRFAWNWKTEPLRRWSLTYAALSDAELAVLQAFFVDRRGRLKSFTWLDPNGNLCQYSESFAPAAWEKYAVGSVGSAVADPHGGTRAVEVTGTTNTMIATVLLPDGDASGFVLTGSVWVKAPAAQSLSIGFIDSGFAVLGNTTWSLPANTWRRISHTITLATAAPIRLLVGGFGTWNAQALALWGAQCVPTAGPGPDIRSPQSYGLRTKCRFDTDELEVRTLGPNQHQVSFSIAEFA